MSMKKILAAASASVLAVSAVSVMASADATKYTVDYVESWIPSCGCSELKRKADDKAKARRKAKELGYIS